MSEQLQHLLSCLDLAITELDAIGCDVDARVIEAHRAQLARGKEWPGDAIAPVVFSDGSSNADLAGLRLLPGGGVA